MRAVINQNPETKMKRFYWFDKDPAGYASGHVNAESKESAIHIILKQLGFEIGEYRYFWIGTKGIPILSEHSINIEEC